jgi:hypothetical protein
MCIIYVGILPDTLMDSTESFENDLSGVFDKFFGVVSEEEIVGQNSFAFCKVILSLFEVEFYVQTI